jgi:dynein intermediate chain 3, axonemal
MHDRHHTRLHVPWCPQLAVRKVVAERWQYVVSEGTRRAQLLVDEQLKAAIEKAKPRSKKARKVKPWVSLGSEVRVERARGG